MPQGFTSRRRSDLPNKNRTNGHPSKFFNKSLRFLLTFQNYQNHQKCLIFMNFGVFSRFCLIFPILVIFPDFPISPISTKMVKNFTNQDVRVLLGRSDRRRPVSPLIPRVYNFLSVKSFNTKALQKYCINGRFFDKITSFFL